MAEEEEQKSVGELCEEDLSSSESNPAGNFVDESKSVPEAEEASPASAVAEGDFKPDIDFKALLMNIEKLNAKVEALREVKFQSDERLKELAESVGELRSMSFQRENAVTELESKIGSLDETVNNIKPETVMKKLEERDRQLEDFSVKLEKLETLGKDMVEQMREVQKVISTIRSVSEVMNTSKDLTMKVRKIEDLKNSVERLSTKTEKIFYEMDKRLTDFTLFKAKVNQMEEMTKELLKAVDQNKIKIEEAPSKDELNEIRVSVNRLAEGESLEKPFSVTAVKKAVRSAVYPTKKKIKPIPLPQDPEALERMKEEVEIILTMLEDEYREGVISERTFYEARTKNEKRLQEVEAQISDIEAAKEKKEEESSPTPSPSSPETKEASPPKSADESIPGEPKDESGEETTLVLPTSLGALRAKKRELKGYIKLLLQDKSEHLISHRDFNSQKKKLSAQLGEIDRAIAKASASNFEDDEPEENPLDQLKNQIKKGIAEEEEPEEKEPEEEETPKPAPKPKSKSPPKKSKAKRRR